MSLINPQAPLEGGEIHDPYKDWMRLARQSYTQSTDWLDINLRGQWEKNLANFNSKHPPGSKYNSELYKKRSRLFRPKTRTTVKKLEAAMTTAFFTNEEVVSIKPNNINDPEQAASANVVGSVMQYRLTNTIPWFTFLVGAIQSAAVNGVAIAHVYWDYQEHKEERIQSDDDGLPMFDEEGPVLEKVTVRIDDKPCIKLVAPENFRIDPGSDWTDPIGSSPYLIQMIPMFVQDVKERMKKDWMKVEDGDLMTGIKQSYDTVRQAREGGRTDRYEDAKKDIVDHDIVWVHKNIIRKDGEDWCFYTVGTEHMLSKPKRLVDMYPHLRKGERPYVMGYSNIESFRVYPAGTVELSQELQAASNDIWNQRFENIRLAMNKRYHLRRDANIDVASLFRNIAGGVVEMDDPDRDVRVIETRDVTSSAYAEQDRINMDFDELQGNFSASTVAGARNLNETVGGMSMLAGNTNMITEFVIRTFGETFVEPVLKQFMRLEQFYENDLAIINLNGAAAEFFPKGGTDDEIDVIMRHELNLKVNVGLNATDPIKKNQHMMMLLQQLSIIPGVFRVLNAPEIIKELFANSGFKNGERFISEDDPRLMELEEAVQQLQGQLQSKEMEMQTRMQIQDMKNQGVVQVATIKAEADLQREQMRVQLGDLEIQIRMEAEDTKRGELMLQRDALVAKILESERDFNIGGKSGVVANNQYGMVPHAEG